MLKMSMDEFLEEIKAEIIGYEELGEERANQWEEKFKKIIKNPKTEKAFIKNIKGEDMVVLEDESELFKMIDQYLAAVDADEEDQYWAHWE